MRLYIPSLLCRALTSEMVAWIHLSPAKCNASGNPGVACIIFIFSDHDMYWEEADMIDKTNYDMY